MNQPTATASALDPRKRNAGFLTFFFSGICAISSGIVVSLLQERYGFRYGMTGTLLSLMNIGNLTAGFLAGLLPGRIGLKRSVLLLGLGYALGYSVMGFTGAAPLLMLCFLLVGLAKGGVMNTCTVLVGDNSPDRTKGMNLMHACYACGALLCPFVIAAAAGISPALPMLALAALGAALWLVYFVTPIEGTGRAKQRSTDWSFLHSGKFWMLTGLLFCQNAAESSVTGWLVTYFKGSGIITAAFSPYTVTVMWGATLIGRLLIAFVFPFKDARRAMVRMGAFCILFYGALVLARTQTLAIALLFCFAFAIAGMNPTAVAQAGRMSTVTSIGVMLPVASSGAILMPWIIGLVAERAGIAVGMAVNIIPCVGMMVFAVLVARLGNNS